MNSGDRRHVLVLGGGIAGLSTAFFLAEEGDVDVTLVEREPRHDAHSSGRSAEMLRVAADDPVTRALARETSRLFDDPRAVGLGSADLVDRTGLFVVTGGDEPAWAHELECDGVAERVDAGTLRERAPHFVPAGDRAHWLPGGGRIRAERLIPALARGATARGARFVRTAGTASVTVNGDAVRGVTLGGGTELPADDVVVAAGAWSRGIAEALGLDLPLRTTRRHMFWTVDDTAHSAAGAPIVWDDAAGFYARPAGRSWGISMCDVTDADADAVPRYPVEVQARARAAALVARHLPRPGPPLALGRGWTGFRDLAPDDRPILGPDGRIAGLHWCAGLGGHGMTLSLGLGRAAAGAVLGRPTDLAAQCGPTRFETPAAV